MNFFQHLVYYSSCLILMKEIYASRPNVLCLNTDLVFFSQKEMDKKTKQNQKGSLRWFHRSSDLPQSSVSQLFWFKGCETQRYLLIDSQIQQLLKEVDFNNDITCIIMCFQQTPPFQENCVECRLRVVPHFSSGIVERAKRERA